MDCPPDDMYKRVIYYYERTLTTQVNDIEHIESQSMPRYGVVKIFFQPKVNINAALAQVTAASQTVLKYPAAGHHAAVSSSASTPRACRSFSWRSRARAVADAIVRPGQNFIRPALATRGRRRIPSPYGGKVRQVQVDLDQQSSSRPTGSPPRTS